MHCAGKGSCILQALPRSPLLYLIPFLLNVMYVDVTKPFLFLFFNYFSEGEEQELSHYGAECQGRGISPSRMGSVWHRGDTAP